MLNVSRFIEAPKPPKKTFSMVFLDLDNTIIPTRLHQVLNSYFGIDIYAPFSAPLFSKLEDNIIAAIRKIKSTLQNDHHRAVIAVVSNANTAWIEQCLGADVPRVTDGPIKLTKLAKFLKDNEVKFFSAKETSYDFLLQKVGKDLATQMIESATARVLDADAKDGHSRKDRWILKYMAFGAIILKYRKYLNMGCSRVISIGDGQDEAMAIKEYSREHKVRCIHFGFLRHPVIEQLLEQWAVIERTFAKLIEVHTLQSRQSENLYTIHQLSSLYKLDNNQDFSGRIHQLPALCQYLNLWIKNLPKDEVSSKMESACNSVRSKMNKRRSKEIHLKIIVHHLVNHNERFLKTWVSAYGR